MHSTKDSCVKYVLYVLLDRNIFVFVTSKAKTTPLEDLWIKQIYKQRFLFKKKTTTNYYIGSFGLKNTSTEHLVVHNRVLL